MYVSKPTRLPWPPPRWILIKVTSHLRPSFTGTVPRGVRGRQARTLPPQSARSSVGPPRAEFYPTPSRWGPHVICTRSFGADDAASVPHTSARPSAQPMSARARPFKVSPCHAAAPRHSNAGLQKWSVAKSPRRARVGHRVAASPRCPCRAFAFAQLTRALAFAAADPRGWR